MGAKTELWWDFIPTMHFIHYPLFLFLLFLGEATSQIGQNDHTNCVFSQLTLPRTLDAAFEVQGRQRRYQERRLLPLQLTTDQGWTEPPGTPAGNVWLVWF